jgi:hypothetical protein
MRRHVSPFSLLTEHEFDALTPCIKRRTYSPGALKVCPNEHPERSTWLRRNRSAERTMCFLIGPNSTPMQCDVAERSRFNTAPMTPAQLGNGKYGDLQSV